MTTTIMNDLEAILRDTEAAARAAKPNPQGRNDPRSRAVLLHDLRHAGDQGTAGAGGSKATTSRCTSPSPTAAPSSQRRRSGAPTRRKCAKGRRRACVTLDKEQDAGRALMMALDEAQQKAATFAEVAPNDILTKTDVVVNPLSPPGVVASAMNREAARVADAADRGLHKIRWHARYRHRAAG